MHSPWRISPEMDRLLSAREADYVTLCDALHTARDAARRLDGYGYGYGDEIAATIAEMPSWPAEGPVTAAEQMEMAE